MARLVVENQHQKNKCETKIGLCTQNIDTNPSLVLNTIRQAYAIV